MRNRIQLGIVSGLAALAALVSPAGAQPWTIFEDANSGSLCGIVNIGNGELVVLNFTGELVDVTNQDVLLCGTFVDDDLSVFVDGEPFGFIDFFTDGDGLASLWWVVDESGEVVSLDEDFLPFPGESFPEDFLDVPCDALEFWDGPLDDDFIFDGDVDGVDDCIDLCPDTPLEDDLIDADGCGCSEVDSDADGVGDCDDLCPETPLEDELIDQDGCGCSEVDSDADGVDDCIDRCDQTPINVAVDVEGCPVTVRPPPGGGGGGGGGGVVVGCGAPGAAALGLTLAAMAGLRLVRRRR